MQHYVPQKKTVKDSIYHKDMNSSAQKLFYNNMIKYQDSTTHYKDYDNIQVLSSYYY